MSTENSNLDPKLSSLLREARVTAPLPPRFQEQVWRRIGDAESTPARGGWLALADWLEKAFRRPALASSYIVVLLLIGLTFGYREAQEKSARSESQWRVRYVQSVDPYLMPRH